MYRNEQKCTNRYWHKSEGYLQNYQCLKSKICSNSYQAAKVSAFQGKRCSNTGEPYWNACEGLHPFKPHCKHFLM
jgi:hypothetical protein